MTTSPENLPSMPAAARRFHLLAWPCRSRAAWAPLAMVGVALLVGGGCSLSDGANSDTINPAKLFKDDFTEDEAWRAKVKRDSFPAAGPDGL